jgi:hypothetical protein
MREWKRFILCIVQDTLGDGNKQKMVANSFEVDEEGTPEEGACHSTNVAPSHDGGQIIRRPMMESIVDTNTYS